MKQYVKILTRESSEIPDDIKANIPNITELKPKAGLFVGPQIWKLLTVNNVIKNMDEIKRELNLKPGIHLSRSGEEISC